LWNSQPKVESHDSKEEATNAPRESTRIVVWATCEGRAALRE
jgi:hypothetical protein